MKTINQAVILAGGLGTRLRPLTYDLPKPMVSVNGNPFLEYLIDLLKDNGIKEIVLLIGYLGEKIKDHFGDGSDFGVSIKYSQRDSETETGKRIKEAAEMLDDTFLLMYSDNYWSLDIKKMMEFYVSKNKKYMMTVYSNFLNITKNNVFFNKDNLIVKYDRERKDKELNGVDIGFFILNKDIVDLMPDSNFSFEREIIPKMIENDLSAFVTDIRYYSITTIKKLKSIEKFFTQNNDNS